MAAKAILILCAQALLIQSAFSQCLGRGGIVGAGLAGPYGLAYDGLGYDGLAYGAGCGLAAPASSGGGFAVTSASPIAPTGLSVVSENAYEGPLTLGGQLPFLGTVALEGVLPTAGAGAVSYGCGNGAVGIVSEGPIATGILGDALAYGPGLAAGIGYGPGIIGTPAYNGIAGFGGCGCGAIY